MIERRIVIGLSLLCALLFSAIAVGSASAAPATNTTAVTCVKVAAGANGEFKDAHCDEKATTRDGFAHKALGSKLGNTTNITVSNETTGGVRSSQAFKGEPFGVKTTVTCTTFKSRGSIGNTETVGGEHKIRGKGTIEYTNCGVTEVAKCTKVKEPIVVKVGSVEGVEGLTGPGPKAEKEAMGLEYKGEGAKSLLTELTLEGTCAIQGKPFPVEGSVIATGGPAAGSVQNNHWSGATQVFEAGNEMSKLTAGGKPATYTGITTTRMEGGDPISATTCTKTSNCLE